MKFKMIELSKRMKAVASMVTAGNIACDVGCDHGHVSIYLIQKGISPVVIAMDVRKGPLEHAVKNIKKYHLEEQIETRLSDGLDRLEIGEADTVILAGMGGRLMQDILNRAEEKVLSLRELVLQPQSEIPLFRAFIREKGWSIVQENIVFEDGKYYPMMRVEPRRYSVETAEDPCIANIYGGLLLKNQNPVLWQYLNFERENTEKLLTLLQSKNGKSERAEKKAELLKKKLNENKIARGYFDRY